jgi:hypothetical protein
LTLGAGWMIFLLGNGRCPLHCPMLNSILSLCVLDASSSPHPHPICDTKTHLQTLLSATGASDHSIVIHWSRRMSRNSPGKRRGGWCSGHADLMCKDSGNGHQGEEADLRALPTSPWALLSFSHQSLFSPGV